MFAKSVGRSWGTVDWRKSWSVEYCRLETDFRLCVDQNPGGLKKDDEQLLYPGHKSLAVVFHPALHSTRPDHVYEELLL